MATDMHRRRGTKRGEEERNLKTSKDAVSKIALPTMSSRANEDGVKSGNLWVSYSLFMSNRLLWCWTVGLTRAGDGT